MVNTASGAELRGAGAKKTLDYGAQATYYCPDSHWHVTCAQGDEGCYAGNMDLCQDLTKERNVGNFEVCGGANWNGISTVCNPGYECVFDNEYHSQCNPKANSRHYAQCGGMNYAGSGVCTEGTYCKKMDEYYSQCQQEPDNHPTLMGGGVYVPCGDDGYAYCQSGTLGCYSNGAICNTNKEKTSSSFKICGGPSWKGGDKCGAGYLCAPSTDPKLANLLSTCQAELVGEVG